MAVPSEVVIEVNSPEAEATENIEYSADSVRRGADTPDPTRFDPVRYKCTVDESGDKAPHLWITQRTSSKSQSKQPTKNPTNRSTNGTQISGVVIARG